MSREEEALLKDVLEERRDSHETDNPDYVCFGSYAGRERIDFEKAGKGVS